MLSAASRQGRLQNMQGDPQLRYMNQACCDGDIDRVNEMIESERQWSKRELSWFLYKAAEGGHVAVCRRLLEEGAEINAAPRMAAVAKSTAVFELFMEYGWNVNDAWMGFVVLP